MAFEDVVHASTITPRKAIGLATDDLLAVGKPAEFTIFALADSDLAVKDSQGMTSTLKQVFEPRHAIIGAHAIAAHRYQPAPGAALNNCPHCGWAL
jgi:dihydroorotase